MEEPRFIEQGYELLSDNSSADVQLIAEIARKCYRSAPKGSTLDECWEANERLVRSLIARGHEAMIEHSWMSVEFVTDRGTSHELVRHRLFSFAQESQRYVNYDKAGIEFILPPGLDETEDAAMRAACRHAAEVYGALIDGGTKPEIARAVLPNATATRIVASGNFREWRHAFKLRCDSHAHPQIRALMEPLLESIKRQVPVIFDDISID